MPKVAEVVRRHEHFVAILRFVASYSIVVNLWAKKVLFFGQKQCFLGKECTFTLTRQRGDIQVEDIFVICDL